MKRYRKSKSIDLNFRKHKWLNGFFMVLLASVIMIGCKDSATGDDSDSETNEEEKITLDLELSSDGSKIGTITTALITDDPSYVDGGFSVLVELTTSNFDPPYDIGIESSNGEYCGTFDVEPDKQGRVPCEYEDYLSDPSQYTVISEDGEGEVARPVPQE